MQAEVLVKIWVFCRARGDVVLECIHIGDNLQYEETMFCCELITSSRGTYKQSCNSDPVGNTKSDGGLVSEENNILENHLTDEDVWIIISEKSRSMNNKGPNAPLSFEIQGGLQMAWSDQEDHVVQDIHVVASSIGSKGSKFGYNYQEDKEV